jgi:hypothetical protein
MSRVTSLGLLGGMLAMIVAAGAIAFEVTKPGLAQGRLAPAESIDPAILGAHLQNERGEAALP